MGEGKGKMMKEGRRRKGEEKVREKG